MTKLPILPKRRGWGWNFLLKRSNLPVLENQFCFEAAYSSISSEVYNSTIPPQRIIRKLRNAKHLNIRVKVCYCSKVLASVFEEVLSFELCHYQR